MDDPHMIKVGESIIINARFITRAEWVTTTLTPYAPGRGNEKLAADAKVTTERWLDVYLVDRKEPYRLRGPVADAAWAALTPAEVPV